MTQNEQLQAQATQSELFVCLLIRFKKLFLVVVVIVVLYRGILLNPRQARSRTNSLFLSITNEA